MALFPSSRCGVLGGVDATRCCPVDLGEVRGQASSVASIDGVADESSPIVHDGERAAFAVGPALLEHTEHHRVEGAGLDMVAKSEPMEPLAHLAGGFSGERERERVAGVSGLGGDAVGDPSAEHPRLARAGTRDHGDQLRFGGDGGALVGVQIGDQRVDIHRLTVRDRPTTRLDARRPGR